MSAHNFLSIMLGRIIDQASLSLPKISLDTGEHVYYTHVILAGKFRVFWSGKLVLELCRSSHWREPVPEDGVALQVVSCETVIFLNRNRCVIERHSSVSHK